MIRKPGGRIELGQKSIKRGFLQRSYSKNGTQLDFLLPGHMQPPDRGDWNDQNHEIAHDADDASGDHYDIWILTFCFRQIRMRFANAANTTGRNHEDDQSEGVEEVPVEDEPDARIIEVPGSALHSR